MHSFLAALNLLVLAAAPIFAQPPKSYGCYCATIPIRIAS